VHPVAEPKKISQPLTIDLHELPHIIEKGHFVDYAVPIGLTSRKMNVFP